jgi:hypothetical protein
MSSYYIYLKLVFSCYCQYIKNMKITASENVASVVLLRKIVQGLVYQQISGGILGPGNVTVVYN